MIGREFRINYICYSQRDSQGGIRDRRIQTTGIYVFRKVIRSLMEKALRCSRFHEEPCPEELFIEGFHYTVSFSVGTYWRSHKNATLRSLAGYATSSIKLQEASYSTKIPSRNGHYDQRTSKNVRMMR